MSENTSAAFAAALLKNDRKGWSGGGGVAIGHAQIAATALTAA